MAEERNQELRASQTPIQIREGAGLEEARYNVEFIEWLRKWSGPLLMLIAVAAGLYALRQYWQKNTQAKQDAAFTEYEEARQGTNVNPDTLISVADTHLDVPSVTYLARLDAADIYLDAVRRGVKPGTTVNPDGTLANAEDAMTAADRDANLAKASESYQWVLDKTQDKPEQAIHTIGALYGLAAVAECKGELDAAKGLYERIETLATQRSFERHAKLAAARIASLKDLATLAPVPVAASVPKPLDTTPKPPPAPAPEPVATPTDTAAPQTPAPQTPNEQPQTPATTPVTTPPTTPPADPNQPK
ncbi:MAG: hypothetical protein U0640_06645 [Phycisphaerales bacterium]